MVEKKLDRKMDLLISFKYLENSGCGINRKLVVANYRRRMEKEFEM